MYFYRSFKSLCFNGGLQGFGTRSTKSVKRIGIRESGHVFEYSKNSAALVIIISPSASSLSRSQSAACRILQLRLITALICYFQCFEESLNNARSTMFAVSSQSTFPPTLGSRKNTSLRSARRRTAT